jgi:ABC-2 type transport system ATP-binding protein
VSEPHRVKVVEAPPALAIETSGLTKRYRRVTALSECSMVVPEGRICALIGPNGAGKTTLLRILADIGFLAQEMPLYRRMSAADHIKIGAHLNSRWDGESARARLLGLDIPLGRAVGTLSGGQRAQVALALTLAKKPRVLLLDEPVAALDPLARRHFLGTLTSAVAETDGALTVMLSSHLIADIERVCDYMILLTRSQVQLSGDIEDLLAEHKVLIGPKKDTGALEAAHTVVQTTTTVRQSTVLVRVGGPLIDPAYEVAGVSLEELVLGYMGASAAPAYTGLTGVGEG